MSRPPGARILVGSFIADPDLEEAVLGDLAEEWGERVSGRGFATALAWYGWEVVRTAPHLARAWWKQAGPAAALTRLVAVVACAIQILLLTISSHLFIQLAGAGAEGTAASIGIPERALLMVLSLGAACLWAGLGGWLLGYASPRAPMVSVAWLALLSLPAGVVLPGLFVNGMSGWHPAALPLVLATSAVLGGVLGVGIGIRE